MTRGTATERASLCALAVTAALWMLPSAASAATVSPTTTLDQYNTDPGQCSLREAVETIAGGSDFGGCTHTGAFFTADTIRLSPGTYELTIDGDFAGNESGDLNFLTTLLIEALPGGPVVIDANGIERIFLFSGELTTDGVGLTGGLVGTPDPMTGSSGGAIFSSSGAALTIRDGAVFGNQADTFGGGIAANGPLTLRNVTVSDNITTDLAGGGLEASGASLSLDHVTITDNHSLHDSPSQSFVAGGLLSSAVTTSIHNSVIAGNTDAHTMHDAPDCQTQPTFSLVSTGGNVLGDASGCTFTSVPSDSVGSPALLGPLNDNGGFTPTHALLDGSPALERGVATCLAADQRGYPRPFPATGACDSGAYERFECSGVPLDSPGPFAGCPGPAVTPPDPPAPPKRKCKKKKAKKRVAGAKKKKRCKKRRKKP